MIKTIDVAWLAGLLEGDGCFMLTYGKYPIIALAMNSGDTVDRAADMWESRVTRHKRLHLARVTGVRAIQWMMMIYPFLGNRRRKKVTEIIRFWRNHSARQRHYATCHPDRLLAGHGLCNPCYQKEWHEKRKLLRRTE